MDLFKKSVSGFAWMLSGQAIQFVLKIIVFIILARLIEVESFGLISAALAVVNITTIFSMIGVGPALVQRPNIEQIHLSTGFAISMTMGGLFATVLYLFSGAISQFMEMPELESTLKFLCIIFPLEGLSVVSRSWLRRNLRFRTIAIAETTTYGLGYGLVGITMACMGYGLSALIAAALVQALLRNIILIKFGPRFNLFKFNFAVSKELLILGGGFTLSKIAGYLARHSDCLIVGKVLGVASLGFYSRAASMVAYFSTFIGQTWNRVFFPIFSQMNTEKERLRSAFEKGTQFLVLVILPVCILGFVLAEELVTILLGAKWWPTVVPFRILSFALLFRTGFQAGDSILQATGVVYRRAWRKYVFLVILILLTIAGTKWGLGGVATGVSLAWFVHFVLTCELTLSVLEMRWSQLLKSIVTPTIAGVAMGAILCYISSLLRASNTNPFLIVCVCVCLVIVYYGLFFVIFPSILFAHNSEWFKGKFRSMVHSAQNALSR